MPVENKSLVKGLAVIETLAGNARPLTAVELSQQLKLARPTLYRILATLLRRGFVIREDGKPYFRSSLKLLDLGHQVLECTDLLEAARPVLRDLAAQFRETVHLAVEEEGRMVYLDKVEGSGPFCTNSRPGRRVPMHCTGLGKAVLAHLPADKVRSILTQHGMHPETPRTILTMAGMERELARVRRQGYAIDDVEFEDGVRCVGAPVFDHRGVPIAAISVSAPVSRMSRTRAQQVGSILREATTKVSRAMGWRLHAATLRAEGPPDGGDVGGKSRRRRMNPA
ncbi:MAG TPA: IclR family transcriptional regulator [Candidatus Methylomirabilis sp.]|nr:IclR family transcriptional regulator [Candidatus Methylomirabilis sp.]